MPKKTQTPFCFGTKKCDMPTNQCPTKIQKKCVLKYWVDRRDANVWS